MKKLTLWVFIAFISSASFAIIKSKTRKAPPMVQKTLNGIDINTFQLNQKYFSDHNDLDVKPTKTSVWFSKAIIHNIVLLLNAEIRDQTARNVPITDGIRIYYISDPSAGVKPLKNEVALVSTISNGKHTINGVIYDWHKDYFDHPDTGKLFKLKNLEGVVCNDDCKKGAVLYQHDPNATDDTNCDFTIPHYRRRKAVETMVMNFGKYPINTYAVWFDIAFWQRMDNDKKHNGVRIYFARHSPDDTNPLLEDRDTFVITTTVPGPDTSINNDYFGCDTTLGRPRINKYLIHLKSVKVANDTSSFSPGQNKGELCPYNCTTP